MKKTLGHNKFKNTGLLFELLVAQITTEIVNRKESTALKILKEHFKKGSLLSEEFVLYQTLLQAHKIENKSVLHELVNGIIEQRNKLDISKLTAEKKSLINNIKKNYNLDEIIQLRLSNYKNLASIYKLFEYTLDDNPVEYSKLKATIIESINNVKKEKDVLSLAETAKQALPEDKDIQNLTYKIMIKKFNKKYDSILSEDQKAILKEYVNNITNSKALTEFIKNKFVELSGKIKSKKIDNDVLKIKIGEITKLFENLEHKFIVNDNDITILMSGYELIKHL